MLPQVVLAALQLIVFSSCVVLPIPADAFTSCDARPSCRYEICRPQAMWRCDAWRLRGAPRCGSISHLAALLEPRGPIFPGPRHGTRLQLMGAGTLGFAAAQGVDLAEQHRAQLNFGI